MSKVNSQPYHGSLSIGEFLKLDSKKNPRQKAYEVLKYIDENTTGQVGLIVETNNELALAIHEARRHNTTQYPTLSGSDMAKLLQEMLTLIQEDETYQNLQQKIQIFPISIAMLEGDDSSNNQVSRLVMDRDLNVINKAVANGVTMFAPPPPEHNERFTVGHDSLEHWTKDTLGVLGGQTRQQYVQAELLEIANNPDMNKVRTWEPNIQYKNIPDEYVISDDTSEAKSTIPGFKNAIKEMESIILEGYKAGYISDEMAYEVMIKMQALAETPNKCTFEEFNKCECFLCYCK